MANGDFAINAVGDAFREVHSQIRRVIGGLDRDALNWRPVAEANSIAVLVNHTLGSEREMLAAVRGLKVPRDRSSEFVIEAEGADLEVMLDLADAWLDEQIGAMTPDDLTAERPRGDRPPRPGLVWMLTNYGHTREHLAQIELTKQLYLAR